MRLFPDSTTPFTSSPSNPHSNSNSYSKSYSKSYKYSHKTSTFTTFTPPTTSQTLSSTPTTHLQPQTTTSSSNIMTYHKRVLPSSLISLSSKKGKEMFKESLLKGYLECYFPLSEQFITQSEPSYCSLSSLTMILNALNYDPNIVWKGVWRWVTEENFICHSNKFCGHSKEKIKLNGMNFEDFEALKICQKGIFIKGFRAAGNNTIEEFRQLVLNSCSAIKHESFIISNFSRSVLNQTGDGHFSPIGGYHEESDSVLILDVARFKYPPYWVPIHRLWDAMKDIDLQTGLPRGYFIVSSNSIICCSNYPHQNKNENCLQSQQQQQQ